jgi:hypothetical protein
MAIPAPIEVPTSTAGSPTTSSRKRRTRMASAQSRRSVIGGTLLDGLGQGARTLPAPPVLDSDVGARHAAQSQGYCRAPRGSCKRPVGDEGDDMPRSENRNRNQLRPSDPNYGPSAEWGWHGGFPRGLRIAGLVSVLILFGLMYPHDQQLGRIHLLWLVGVAAVILIAVALPRKGRP